MPLPSSLDLLYACIVDSSPDRFPKRISPEENLLKMVDLIAGNVNNIIDECECFVDEDYEDGEYREW